MPPAHPPDLFDMELRALRRDRAARQGAELFLLERAFEDCLDRLSLLGRSFDNALLIGCPDAGWPARLAAFAATIDVREPGRLFADRASGEQLIEDAWTPPSAAYDLILAVGTLDTVNDLPRAILTIRWAMRADGLFIGALSGGDTLPRLRSAMRAADEFSGGASPHVHPRVEASSLAALLGKAGFANAVVDIERIAVTYPSLRTLVRDLRRMGATNILAGRSRRAFSKAAFAAAEADFAVHGQDGRTTEQFEMLHFACWAPAPDRLKRD